MASSVVDWNWPLKDFLLLTTTRTCCPGLSCLRLFHAGFWAPQSEELTSRPRSGSTTRRQNVRTANLLFRTHRSYTHSAAFFRQPDLYLKTVEISRLRSNPPSLDWQGSKSEIAWFRQLPLPHSTGCKRKSRPDIGRMVIAAICFTAPGNLSNTLPASKYKPVNGSSAVVGGGSLASSNRIVNQNANRPSFTTVLPSTSTVAFTTGVLQPNSVLLFPPSSWLFPMPI